MDAGRELDALVAEKVMGYTPFVSRYDHFGEPKTAESSCPEYSTDIAAAWQVAEHLVRDGHRVDIGGVFYGQLSWYCGLDADMDGHSNYGELADTAPLAICRAALAAVGAEVPA